MKIVSIDLSSNTGIAYFDTEQQDYLVDCFDYTIERATPMTLNRTQKLSEDQLVKKSKRKRTLEKYDSSKHPNDFLFYVDDYIEGLIKEINSRKWVFDYIVIEQTNKGRDRWKQKLLEWLHYKLCYRVFYYKDLFDGVEVKYIDTMEWRKILGIKVSKEDKRANRKIRIHNKEVKVSGEKRITGIVKDKDMAIEFCEKKFNLSMSRKDNNIADAMCIGYGYLLKNKFIKNEDL